MKKQLFNYTLEELKAALKKMGEPGFRGDQIFVWLYKKHKINFDAMSNLSKKLRSQLADHYDVSTLTVEKVAKSNIDVTHKYLFRLADDHFVESVYMQDKKRVTLCISTMVGCPVGCPYCATGLMGFHRNLSTAEIVNQLVYINSVEDKPVTNIVFMGMGEPFLNYDNVIQAAKIFNSPSGPEISARKITISTCGIVSAIQRYTKEGHKYKLAVSLNGSNDEQRNIMVPVNKKTGTSALIRALKDFTKQTKQRVTFEYILVKGFNDSKADAKRLKQLLSDFPCKLNVIPYNENEHCAFQSTTEKELDRFIKELYKAPFAVTVRRSKGQDIDAACGQLYAKEQTTQSI